MESYYLVPCSRLGSLEGIYTLLFPTLGLNIFGSNLFGRSRARSAIKVVTLRKKTSLIIKIVYF